jgi:hypothetical protein
MTVQIFVRNDFTVIAAPVQSDVDGISKWSHYVRLPIATGRRNVRVNRVAAGLRIIVASDTFDAKLAGGNSGATIYSGSFTSSYRDCHNAVSAMDIFEAPGKAAQKSTVIGCPPNPSGLRN